MHSVPAIVDRASLWAAGAAPGIGNRRACHVDQRRYGNFRQGKDCFALWISDIVVHHVAGTKHDRHAQIPGRIQRLVDAGNEGVHPHRGRLAPVIVPDVHRDHTDSMRIDAHRRSLYGSGRRVTRLKGQCEFGRLQFSGLGHPTGARQEQRSAEQQQPNHPAKRNHKIESLSRPIPR